MLFNSFIFILVFLPVTLLGYYLIGGRGFHKSAILWLVGASLVYYGWWNPVYLWLIIGSVIFNYSLGRLLHDGGSAKLHDRPAVRKGLLTFGITLNLFLLGYYKFANFFVDNINWVFGSSYNLEKIILPLAISFFTFQQISFLVDTYRGETKEYNFLHYALFVTFFPQLVAGPIVHHKDMLPQFAEKRRFSYENISIGTVIFLIGLIKKIWIADGVADFAKPAFAAAELGETLTFIEAWGGALAYTFQIYFDFSGYSDMAIGLGRMFGITLPQNFYSPYKATSIIDFWKRWHITLSTFLRDYLYIPLGGNRKGKPRKYVNLMITMLLGGLWHGAGWTFVIWGALHGTYLVINHGYRAFKEAVGLSLQSSFAARMLTFMAVVLAWVFFRAESLDGALVMVQAMLGLNGMVFTPDFLASLGGLGEMLTAAGLVVAGELQYFKGTRVVLFFVVLWIIAWHMPNTQEIMRDFKPALGFDRKDLVPAKESRLRFKFSYLNASILALLIWFSMHFMLSMQTTEFLYYDF